MEKWQDPKVIGLWIAIIIVLIFTILLFVVSTLYSGYKKMTEANLREAKMQLDHQKKLLDTNLQSQENERKRIAGDLHDSLIGKLTVIRMKNQVAYTATEIDELLGESIAEARRISHDLTPPLIEFLSIEELINQLITPWQQKMHISFYSDVRTDEVLSPQIKIQILRVMQELVTNIIKHAHATQVQVHLRHTHKKLILRVNDNGRGFDPTQLKAGIGLQSLELRMQYLNAIHRIKPVNNKGTTALVVATL